MFLDRTVSLSFPTLSFFFSSQIQIIFFYPNFFNLHNDKLVYELEECQSM